jgi:Fe-S oxidoreductase
MPKTRSVFPPNYGFKKKSTEAKAEMRRSIAALAPAVARGVPVIGLEPSCLMTFRDEMPALLGDEWTAEQAGQVMLFEEFIAARLDPEGGGFALPLAPLKEGAALLHGHCHQKAFNAVAPVQEVLALIPGLDVELVQSSCCGMAGSFGYQAETAEISRRMGELNLLPRLRAAGADTLIVADGTSCRHQIEAGAAREAVHVARLLRQSSDLALN